MYVTFRLIFLVLIHHDTWSLFDLSLNYLRKCAPGFTQIGVIRDRVASRPVVKCPRNCPRVRRVLVIVRDPSPRLYRLSWSFAVLGVRSNPGLLLDGVRNEGMGDMR